MTRTSYHLMAPEVRRIRGLGANGLPHAAIARLAGVTERTVRRHLRVNRSEALRVEALFASCNRALAEAAR